MRNKTVRIQQQKTLTGMYVLSHNTRQKKPGY